MYWRESDGGKGTRLIFYRLYLFCFFEIAFCYCTSTEMDDYTESTEVHRNRTLLAGFFCVRRRILHHIQKKNINCFQILHNSSWHILYYKRGVKNPMYQVEYDHEQKLKTNLIFLLKWIRNHFTKNKNHENYYSGRYSNYGDDII